MPPFWSDFARTLRRSAPLLLLFATFQALIGRSDDELLPLTYLLMLPLSYYLFRAALFDEGLPGFAKPTSAGPYQQKAFFRYLLTSLPVVALGFVVCFLIAVLCLLVLPKSAFREVLPFTPWVGTWVVLMAVGPLLPSAAAGQPFVLRTTLHVARIAAARTALPLLLIPLLTYLGALQFGIQVADTLRFVYVDTAIRFGIYILFLALVLVSFVVGVVILSRAYRRAWPGPSRTAKVFT